jgi:hypothetical protein
MWQHVHFVSVIGRPTFFDVICQATQQMQPQCSMEFAVPPDTGEILTLLFYPLLFPEARP